MERISKPTIELRGLEPRDIDAVLAIQSAVPEAAQWKREAYEAMLQVGADRMILAELPSTLVGFVGYRIIAPEAELLSLAVLPAFRRRGIGARLLQEVIRDARMCGVSDLFLEVREGNRVALRLYEQFGFQITSRRSGYYRDPPADALMLHCRIGTDAGVSPHSSATQGNPREKNPH